MRRPAGNESSLTEPTGYEERWRELQADLARDFGVSPAVHG
jgi:hypothetical protein